MELGGEERSEKELKKSKSKYNFFLEVKNN